MIEPLYSNEAEKSVLASMMSRPDEIIDNVSDSLNEQDFFVPIHKDLFTCLIKMYNDREPIDILTLQNRMVSSKKAHESEGVGYIIDIAGSLATHLNCSS